MKYGISRFDSFSVREEDAIDICKQNFGIDVAWVMDPVFLCDKKCMKIWLVMLRENTVSHILHHIYLILQEKNVIL